MMEKACYMVTKLGFDGIDINMGCPDKSIEKQGAGASLIKNPEKARELIKAAKQGIKNASLDMSKDPIPLSVKTRIGYNSDQLEEWLVELLKESPDVITIHARTRKEMSKVPARWERIKRAVEIRDQFQKDKDNKTLIFGNGDIRDINHAYKLCEDTGCDGVMLGRAIFGNPWAFSDHIPKLDEKLKALVEHSLLFEEKLGGIKNFSVMKKHFKSYLSPKQSVDWDSKIG
jgi:tRNA-dihydrouridine synthase